MQYVTLQACVVCLVYALIYYLKARIVQVSRRYFEDLVGGVSSQYFICVYISFKERMWAIPSHSYIGELWNLAPDNSYSYKTYLT